MKYLSDYIIKVADFASDLPFAYVNTEFEKLGLWFVVAFVFLLAAMLLYNYSVFPRKGEFRRRTGLSENSCCRLLSAQQHTTVLSESPVTLGISHRDIAIPSDWYIPT